MSLLVVLEDFVFLLLRETYRRLNKFRTKKCGDEDDDNLIFLEDFVFLLLC